MFTPFVNLLREYGVPATPKDVLDLYRGMERGIAGDLDQFLILARLCFVRRVEHMDAFERAFALYFCNIDIPAVAEGDYELLNTKQFRDWLRDAIARGEIQPVTENLSREELMERFWDTIREQMEAHNGGDKWVGTGGRSPFGHSGAARDDGGVRVFGQGGNRSALKVIGDRRYADYSQARSIGDGNIRQALDSLKNLRPAGAHTELDIDETISRTARNGGEIELVFDREIRDKIEVVLLMDNGGSSMTPFVDTCRKLFARIKSRFRNFDAYYFHNTVYESVYKDPARTEPLAFEKLMERSPETRVLILGDASMAPHELLSSYGSIYYGGEDSLPSIERLRQIRARFPASAWLNPIPREYWEPPYGAFTIPKIRDLFHMEDLTLAGIKGVVEYLNRQAPER